MPVLDWLAICMELIPGFECPHGPALRSFVIPGEHQATIGYGRAISLSLHPKTITLEQAKLWLAQDIHTRFARLQTTLSREVLEQLEAEFIAGIVSWLYNGTEETWHCDSFKALLAGNLAAFIEGAATWFHGANHVIDAGLVRRRAVEVHLEQRGEWQRIKSALNWYMDLVPQVNESNRLKKSGHLVMQGDRVIWQVAA